MTIPWNFKQYYQNLAHLKQRGHVSSGEQIQSPVSAGSRGLANVEHFADKSVQMMGSQIDESADRQYQNLEKDSIEKLRQKYLPDWEYKDNSLQKRYKFEDYFQVIKFLIDTIKPQEELDHHADLGVFYDEVLVKIYTHRTKDVTDYDFKVALQMDMIAKKKHGAIKPDYDLSALVDDFDFCINCGDLILNERKYQGGLRKWFKQKWVNIAKKKKGGGHPECGTSGSKRGYAKCVPASKARSMSKKQKRSAVSRKRAAQRKAGRGGKDTGGGAGKKPIRVSTKPKK